MSQAPASNAGGKGLNAGASEVSQRPLQWSIIHRVLIRTGPYKFAFLAAVLLAMLAMALDITIPLLIAYAVDEDIKTGDTAGLLHTAGLMLAVVLAVYVTRSISAYTLRLTIESVFFDMRQAVFDKLQAADIAYFDATPVGWLISRGHRDLMMLVNHTLRVLVVLAAGVTTVVGIGIVLVIIDWHVLAILLAVTPGMWIASYRFHRRGRSAWRRVRKDISRLTASVAEMASGVRVVQAFTREEENLGQFDTLNLVNARSFMRTARYHGKYLMAVEGMAFTSAAVVLGVMGWKIGLGAATVGGLFACWRYVGRFFGPVRQMAGMYNNVLLAMAAGERVFGLLDREVRIADRPDATELGRIEGYVTFEHVDFEYEPGRPILRDVSFEAKPGQTIALVGPTGCGKTTIVSLLNRFYDVKSGRILVDGHDIRDIQAASLHRQTGLILQENFLFDGTVMANLKHARPDISDEDVISVCKTLGCHPIFERLVQGYETLVGERGENLSAGQRQLVSIARAMVASPRILMLDEATSCVDTQTELAIQYALERLIEQRTSFVVAHRLSTVRRADQILVVEDGRITERGTHAELVKLGGHYAGLHEEFMKVEEEF